MKYYVKELSEIAGVSVRTLHHYDRIGLLRAKREANNGYRYYDEEAVMCLQNILFYRELGFELKEIGTFLESGRDEELLSKHRVILIKKKKRLEKIIGLIDEMEKGEQVMTKNVFDAFSMKEIEHYKEAFKEEVEEKYDPKVVEESRQKTGKYSKEDWKRVTGEGNVIFSELAELMDQDPSDTKVQELIGKYRTYINDNFYTCTDEIFKGLGELYVVDERFTKNIDKHGEGLSSFLSDAIIAYYE
jgi:DNA-binding transcriptional MerR regulator